ncbi:16S rRNA (guanine(966)-N(2))-methyltransferase RsmD [Anaerorhabdus sp.]|uniref:16S rRNA (guanine(966)-N(2))-methyltransferase RsmD n=1 Tax=Anaerorhabdus sp. TaxID=1872524 RepID=UPI002FCB12B3
MRIIAGKHRSRVLKTRPGQDTRPTLDKVKESIFSSIGPYFDGGKALDLFAGSGAIGLECISRGMDSCVFVDASFDAIKIIKENITALKEVENCICLKMDYKRALQSFKNDGISFDFIYLDPPYGKVSYDEILTFIDMNLMLNKEGIIICEGLKEDVFTDTYKSFKIKKEAIYGITSIVIYKRNEESQ